MTTVSIIYFTSSGNTAKMVEAIEKGASSVDGVKTNLIAISGENIVKGRYQNDEVMTSLDASDAIIFGSPTYMGGPAAQFKAFADAPVVDKWSAGFTVSDALSGDKFSNLQYFHTLAMQHGMILVGLGEMPGQPNGVDRLGDWGGAMAQSTSESPAVSPKRDDLLTAEKLGRRVATSAARMKG